MRELWRSLIDDKTVAVRALRALLAVAGIYGMQQGWFSAEVGAALGGGALFLGSGDKNA